MGTQRRRQSRRSLLILTLAGMLAACAALTTPYQADVAGQRVAGGYYEEELATGRFRVTFSGTPATPRRALEQFLLRRCAELTLQEGFDWFRIVARSVERDVHVYVAPDNSYRIRYSPGYRSWKSYWRLYRYGLRLEDVPGNPLWWPKGSSSKNRRLEAQAEIVMGRGTAPMDTDTAFDARRLLSDPAFAGSGA